MPINTDELRLASEQVSESILVTELSVPGIHCGGCMSRIEKSLSKLGGVESIRVNLTQKRVSIKWKKNTDPSTFVIALEDLGFESELFSDSKGEKDAVLSLLLKALAVSGFASGNIMLLSVSVWSGADELTRQLFHWISAAIAIPAVLYSGQVFFKSAWRALKQWRTNMDVPICVGIFVTTVLSLYETVTHSSSVYFEASVMLVFFLLIGRTLDHTMRRKAASTVNSLQALEPLGAKRKSRDGIISFVAVDELMPGDEVLVSANSRIPTDGCVVAGRSSLNTELVNGESIPAIASVNDHVYAGTLNLSEQLTIRVTESVGNSFVAKMNRMIQQGQSSKGQYRVVADRVASLYAPVVHISAFLAFVFWMMHGVGIHQALTISVAVLIITCPCALALAVPMVQAVAAQRLFRAGVVMKNGAALEKLASVDTVVFDKTGTLTQGFLLDTKRSEFCEKSLMVAKVLALSSEHPYSKAILVHAEALASLSQRNPLAGYATNEIPGYGIQAKVESDLFRLGRRSWALDHCDTSSELAPVMSESVLSKNGKYVASFIFNSHLKAGTVYVVNTLRQQEKRILLLSGDVDFNVSSVAASLSIHEYKSQYTPFEKLAAIEGLQKDGCKVLMVGDGLNDSGAMARAEVSMSPGSGASATRSASDFVLLGSNMQGVTEAISISKRAERLVKQNFAIAIAYNLVAIPAAFMGLVTPLVAALAMSSSSILVIANSMRILKLGTPLNKSSSSPLASDTL